MRPLFKRLLWVPGNHELWTLPSDPNQARGEARYLHGLVDKSLVRVETAGDDSPRIAMLDTIREYGEAVQYCRSAGDQATLAIALINLGDLSRARGDVDHAATVYLEALRLCETIGGTSRVPRRLEGLAGVALSRGEADGRSSCSPARMRRGAPWPCRVSCMQAGSTSNW